MKGTSFEKVADFESEVVAKGNTFGVIYQSRQSKTSGQIYMREKKILKETLIRVVRKYASVCDGKLTLKKINSFHSHHLLTSEQIKIVLSQSIKSIPVKCQDEAYSLFLNRESTKTIFDLIKKFNFLMETVLLEETLYRIIFITETAKIVSNTKI